jgi:proteasome lid subunit RPN8/RPN11
LLQPLERIVLTDGVSRSLFAGYAEHRQTERGDNETGWLLMGHRHGPEALALATLPAGVFSEAGVAHVRFNSVAQATASRILRLADRELTILGVVHTHPGSLRRPSQGDYRGDREWVKLLRGGEGAFAIGTAENGASNGQPAAVQPSPSSQRFHGLRFDWFALASEDRNYRALPVQVTLGPDVAAPLHRVWETMEAHAPALEHLCRRLAGIGFAIDETPQREAVIVTLPPHEGHALRVVLRGAAAEFYVIRGGEVLAVNVAETAVDRGVFLILAELSSRST